MQISLEETCALAQGFAKHYGHKIGVVIHLSESDMLIEQWDLKNKVVAYYKQLLTNYPEVDFYVENTIPFEAYNNNRNYCRCGTLDEPVYFVHKLNCYFADKYGTRFYTCLDTCHFLSTLKVYELANVPTHITLDNVFKLYGETCKNIHLANIIGTGYPAENHGTGFQNDITLLERFLIQIKEYMPNANIVLEMREKDLSILANIYGAICLDIKLNENWTYETALSYMQYFYSHQPDLFVLMTMTFLLVL